MTTSAIPLPREDSSLTAVSEKLVPVRLLGAAPWALMLLLMGAGINALTALVDGVPWWLHLFAIPFYLIVLLWIPLLPRRTRAIAYAMREDDLVLRHGLMFRSFSAVPYGRVQDMTIDEGPIERMFGLSHVTVKTAASATSTLTIPGLRTDESARLRAHVMREAAEKMAAL